MAELMGKSTGICKGRAGLDALWPTTALGSLVSLRSSAAAYGCDRLRTRCKGERYWQVTLCCFGNGAVNQGTFHESLNMTSLWRLPVIYFCENNGYAITTSVARSCGQPDIAKRAAGYGLPGLTVDGQDVRAVFELTHAAVARACRGPGRTLIEAKIHRFGEHNVGLLIPGDPYRPSAGIEQYNANEDPIVLYRRVLLAEGIRDSDLAAMEAEVAAEVEQAIQFGESPLLILRNCTVIYTACR